jgi:hypothetical protein
MSSSRRMLGKKKKKMFVKRKQPEFAEEAVELP